MNNNQKATKRALLTSVMALVMCVVMLVGTTFAWFTDTASTGVNKIQAGNLDIELAYKNSTTRGEFKEANKETPVFDNNALWEPGHVEYVVLRVSNAGSLALKYKLGINIANEVGSTNVYNNAFKLSDYIRFAVLDGDRTGNSVDRDALVAAATDSKLIKEGYTAEKHLTATGTDNSQKVVTLVVWMPTTVGNEANYKVAEGITAPSIDLGINVVATQDTVERDSFNDQYDAKAQYPATVSEIKAKYGVDGLKMPEGVVITTERDPEGTNGSLTTVTLKDYEAFVYFTQVFDHAKAYEARKELLTNDPSKLYPNEHPNNIWYTGYIYKLTVKMDCDIDLENASVNPFLFADIGNSAFTFDGNGHTIKNANLASSTGNVAFFGKGVSVKNVTLDNIHVTATGNPEGQSAGIVSSNANADIDNVTVKNSSVIGGKWTGGIVGYNYGSITNCTVENCTVSGQYKVGGIVGYICGSNDPVSVTGNKLTNVTVKAENVLAGKTAIIGKIVSNWNAPAGTCNNNDFSGMTVATENIGKIESGCNVAQ